MKLKFIEIKFIHIFRMYNLKIKKILKIKKKAKISRV